MGKRARRTSPSRRYRGWKPDLFPEGPDGKVPSQVTLKAVFMNQNVEHLSGQKQFFLVDLQEMAYLTIADRFLEDLPTFSHGDEKHAVLELLVQPAPCRWVDAHVVRVKPLEDIIHEEWDRLMDIWINKSWGPAV